MAADEASERQDRLWITLQAIADAVVIVDPDGAIEHLNPAAERLSGWSRSEALGLPVERVMDLRRSPSGKTLESPARRALENGAVQVLPKGAWLKPRSGASRRVGDTASPILAEDGTVSGAVMVLQDLTERDRLQGLLARADRLSSMGTMAAAIAHEVNNPLTHMLLNVEGAVQALQEPHGDAEEALAALQDIALGAKAIERIVHDLKLLSTPDQRSVEAVDVASVLRRTQRMAAKTVRARGRFEASLPHTQPVLANAVALGQVVTNLVINAAQSLPEGYSADCVVRLSCEDLTDEVLIQVEDNGSGIRQEELGRIFDPFFTTKAVGEGTGLGLAICHQIVTDLGGRIEVSSQVGVGSTFRVFLPATSVTPDDEDELVVPVDGSWPRRRVLVVDDDHQVRRAIGQGLRRIHDVELLRSVDEAADRIRKGFGYDAILCDLMMSPRNGLELLDELSVLAPDLVQRTAFITGGVFAGALQERVLRSGRPVAYKPFARGDLLRLVESLALS